MARKFAKQIGALWTHQNDRVGEFWTGVLDLGVGEVPIAVFRNDRKEEGKKQPDFRIVLSGNWLNRGSNGGKPNRAHDTSRKPPKARSQSADDQPPY